MPKGRKKRKKKEKNPPLCRLDNFIYESLLTLGVILLIVVAIAVCLIPISIGRKAGAISTEISAALLLVLIPILPAIIVAAAVWSTNHTNRTPIFGKQNEKLVKKRIFLKTWKD